MTQGTETLRLTAAPEGDPLRMERLTASLKSTLAQVDGVAVDHGASDPAAGPGEKGGTVSDLTLLVGIVYGSRAAADVLVAAIREWASRERHRRVQVSRDAHGTSVEITGSSEEAQRDILDRLFGVDGGER